MRRVLPLALAALLPSLPAPAQDAEAERDRGFIAGLIEDNLSAPGLAVRIDGFEGALSSAASLDVLEVSDDAGVWLRLEDVVLDWNRSALLRGRLEVEELSAALIRVERAPLPPEGVDALPDAGAPGGFRLPDLPVSVDIATLHADRIELGASLAGQDVALALDAAARLADGSGEARVDARRLDGPEGTFGLAIAFDAQAQVLDVDLSVSEAEGGLAATLLSLPGTPAIDLTLVGAGPLDGFAADVAVASGGTERLGGQITLNGVEDGRRFAADIGGDVTSLLAPRYRAFFGEDVSLVVAGLRRDDGRLELDALDLRTQALALEGEVRLGADGWPVLLDVAARLEAPDGTPVVLPVAAPASVRQATLTLAYDAAVSEAIALDLRAIDVVTGTATLGDASVQAEGTIAREGGTVVAARAAVEAALNELGFADPALAAAAGPRIGLSGDVAWDAGGPVRLSDLALAGPDYRLTGSVGIDGTDPAAPLTLALDLDAALDDLSRLAGLVGREGLAGAAEATLAGDWAPIAGTFDVALEADARGLETGIAQADSLLQGQAALTLAARRTVEGTYLDALRLEAPQASVEGSAVILAGDAPSRAEGALSRATLAARIEDGAVLDPRLPGPVTFAADAAQDARGVWQGRVDATAPQGVTLTAEGDLTGAAPDVTFAAAVPEIGAFVDGVPGGLDLSGRAFAVDGVWAVDAEAAGPWGLTARVEGPVTGEAPRIAFDATLPDLAGPVPALAGQPALRGPVTLAGTLARTGSAWSVDASAEGPSGVTLRARGPVTGEALRLEVAGTVPEVQAFVPAVEGRLDLDGVLERTDGDLSADLTARGPYGAVVTARTVLTQAPLSVAFTADLADLSQLAPVPGGLSLTGEAVRTDTGFRIDVDGTGPYDATVDAVVDLADGVPTVEATGRIPDAGALAPQLSGPLDYAVRAEQVEGQLRLEATAEGAQALRAEVSGIATGADAVLAFTLRAGDVAAFVPGLPGALDASGRAYREGGQWAVDVDARGPLGATLDAQAVVTGAERRADFALAVPDIGPLVPDIPGPLRATGTARQDGDGYAVDIDLSGPAGTQAAVTGRVGAGLALDLSVEGSAPLGLANPAVAPQRLSGVARFDLDVDGPAGLDSVSGTVSTTGAALSLPTLRNALEGIDGRVTLSGGRAQVDLAAGLETGGRLTASGPIGLAAPFPAELAVAFDVTLVDPRLYTADVAGRIALTGPLAGGARIAGAIRVDGAEISVPSSGLTAVGDLPEITHLGATRPVRRTLALAGQDAASLAEADARAAGGGGPVYGLDLVVEAPGRIFVRGRGLDAELGGTIRLGGTTANPVTAGGFELLRGRLDILEQRFDLDEGRIDFTGGLVPVIRLVAVTQSDTLTASIVVEGPADDIAVRFESTPEVPQEEIVAQIFFGRDLSALSPLQALQLANSVAVLAGRGNGGLLESLRGSAGLDDLDITTDDEGNVALRAGKYLTDNVYTDVQVDQDGQAALSLNLDVTPSLTVRGGVGAGGDTSLGLFFERDY